MTKGLFLSEAALAHNRTKFLIRGLHEKARCMTASMAKRNWGMTVVNDYKGYRCITPEECELLQTLPIGYTAGHSKTQRYKMLGNAWTCDIIKHLLKGINKKL